jgi:hypothetical protein
MAEVRAVGRAVTYNIEGLTEEEIAFLYAVMMNTSGPMNSPRKHAESIRVALDEVMTDTHLNALYEDMCDCLQKNLHFM